ncbi:hypothetical protein, partial [uncultured Cellulomonas sp.]|uniref:hypothetical protein n=1 Tax=uncultured Cellulomonas sp. TaxID=189682 RepID=UPI002639E9EA
AHRPDRPARGRPRHGPPTPAVPGPAPGAPAPAAARRPFAAPAPAPEPRTPAPGPSPEGPAWLPPTAPTVVRIGRGVFALTPRQAARLSRRVRTTFADRVVRRLS